MPNRKQPPESPLVIGVDVGTGSARAGVFDLEGNRLGIGVTPIRIWRPETDFVEQSSDNIWSAVCRCVSEAMDAAGARAERVAGVGFDATCSLVVLDREGKPLGVSPSGKPAQNVIAWMDHRATPQAEKINALGHPVLKYVGGRISPEMETPKLLWLKNHMPGAFAAAGHFFDLPDWLAFRATGDATRSLCTTVCKWTYLGHEQAPAGSPSVGRWEADYFEKIGLGELAREGFERIGTRVRPMGEAMGAGLTPKAAKELGLLPGTAVGVAIIDAHAGGLGLMGISTGKKRLGPADFEKRLALIAGTSSCHMAASRAPMYIQGIWGPYFSAMIPGMWLTEAGQSASGALLDHIVFSHARSGELEKEARIEGTTVYELLNRRLSAIAESRGVSAPALLTADRHVLPYFHGNRSPRADPSLRGMMTGLPLDNSADELAILYLATLHGIAYGTRHIVEEMKKKGYSISTILATGGGARNRVYLQEHADITGCEIVLGREPESVLLGSAILGAVASGNHADIPAAMQTMSQAGDSVRPRKGKLAAYHQKKYHVFHELYAESQKLRRIME